MMGVGSTIRSALVASLAVSLTGCWKDRLEIVLNADGSGSVRQAVTWSERYIVAAPSGDLPMKMPLTEDALREKIGSALEITSIKFVDLPDGGRRLDLAGKFDTASQLFLSEYCQDVWRLRLVSTGPDRVAILCSMEMKDDGQLNVTKLYGLAKGLYVERTVHLPVGVEKTNGVLAQGDGKTVSWVFDLRNRDGLNRTKAFVEGKDEGRGLAVIPASALTFALPLQPEGSPKAIATPPVSGSVSASDLEVAVSWIAWRKISAVDGDTPAPPSELQIGLTFVWPEDKRPVAYYAPLLTHLTDDQGNDLVWDSQTPGKRHQIFRHGKQQELRATAKSPRPGAVRLKNLAGYVKVVTGLQTERVVLENIKELVGKESTGNPILDRLHCRITSITGVRLGVSIDGGRNTISSIEMVKPDGSKITSHGGMGIRDTYHYDFAEPLSNTDKCELEVTVSENTVSVPFHATELDLP